MAYLSVVLVMLLLAAGLVLPIAWVLRAWLDDRVVSAPLAIGAMAAHAALFAVFAVLLFVTRWAMLYSVGVLLLLAALPMLTRRADRRTHHGMASEDIARCRRLLARDPRNAAAHAALGDACMVCELYDEAAAAYEQAIALDPRNMKHEVLKLQKAHERLGELLTRRK